MNTTLNSTNGGPQFPGTASRSVLRLVCLTLAGCIALGSPARAEGQPILRGNVSFPGGTLGAGSAISDELNGAQRNLDAKLAAQKEAQLQLELATKAARDAAARLDAVTRSASVCVASLPILGKTAAQVDACKAGLADAERNDASARAMMMTKATALAAANAAVVKATNAVTDANNRRGGLGGAIARPD